MADERKSTSYGAVSPESDTDSRAATGCAGACARSRRRRIKTSHVILLALAAAGGAALLASGVIAGEPNNEFHRHGEPATITRAGWGRGADGEAERIVELVCDGKSEELVERFDERFELLETFVDFGEERGVAWDALKEAVYGSISDFVDQEAPNICAQIDSVQQTYGADTAPAHMARAELMLSAGQSMVQSIRGRFEDFYMTLDADQQAALDKMINRHRH